MYVGLREVPLGQSVYVEGVVMLGRLASGRYTLAYTHMRQPRAWPCIRCTVMTQMLSYT